jgi:hypothetical protein
MKSGIFFVKRDPLVGAPNSLCVDFLKRSIRMPHGEILNFDQLLQFKSERIAYQVSMLLSQLNEKNYSLRWWSYIFTAKNPLSSPIFNELIDIIILLETMHKYLNEPISVYVVNARYSQRMVVSRFFENQSIQVVSLISYKLVHTFRKIYAFIRVIFLIFISTFFAQSVKQIDDKKRNKIGIFTYIDGANRSEQDPFFGKLINHLKDVEKTSVEYIFYLYRPFTIRKKELSSEKNNFILLFSYLTWRDIFWTIISVVKELFAFYKNQLIFVIDRNVSLYPIIREYMIFELGRGYTDNLLVFRAARNMASSGNFQTIIYPFENKSLEKALLLGLNSQVKTIGYQHSSISPRHYTFKLQGKEPLITPMPDKVITVGEVTHQWLMSIGNFPAHKIQAGFSLRHNLESKFDKKSFEAKKTKLLFAFSSCYSEISNAIAFLKPIVKQHPEIVLRFRNHINFPFNQLGQNDQNWINQNVEKGPRKTLLEDIEWSDVVVYISSTVALEALFCGAPVILLNISLLNSDPLLTDNVPYRWECSESKDFFVILEQIASLGEIERLELQQQSTVYVNKYLKKGTIDDYKFFLNPIY